MLKQLRVSALPFVYQFAMLFGFTSKIRLGPFTSFSITILIATIYLIFHLKSVNNIFRTLNSSRIKISFVMLLCTIIIMMFHSIETHIDSVTYVNPITIITLITSVCIMGLWTTLEVKTIDRFAKLMVCIGFLQGIFIIISIINPTFQQYVADHFMYEGFYDKFQEQDIDGLVRVSGLGIAWSSGSLVLAYCCLMLIMLRLNARIGFIPFVLLYLFIAGATAFMGRTGLVVELCFLLYYVFSTGNFKNILSLTFIIIGGVLIISRVLCLFDPFIAEATTKWILGFLNIDSIRQTNIGIVKGGFPPFSPDFIFGTGIEYGNMGTYAFFADSGYIKSYTSIGVVGMISYYFGILYLLISPLNKYITKNVKNLIQVAIMVLLVMEYKEPFIAMCIYPWVIFTMTLLCNQETLSIKK